jgi:hypothetical protein
MESYSSILGEFVYEDHGTSDIPIENGIRFQLLQYYRGGTMGVCSLSTTHRSGTRPGSRPLIGKSPDMGR